MIVGKNSIVGIFMLIRRVRYKSYVSRKHLRVFDRNSVLVWGVGCTDVDSLSYELGHTFIEFNYKLPCLVNIF